MARAPSWYQLLTGALDVLQAGEFEWVDRLWVEQHLQLSRRDAIRFLHRFGAVEGPASEGRMLRVNRSDLLQQLAAVAESPPYLAEQRRREQVGQRGVELCREAASRDVLFPAPPPELVDQPPPLPSTVRLRRTVEGYRLIVEASDPLDLLRQNYLLGLLAAHDLEGYFASVEQAPLEEAVTDDGRA